MASLSRRFLIPILTLFLLAAVGCTRTRPPRTFPESLVTLPPPTPVPVRLPRFTPHVTSTIPTSMPASTIQLTPTLPQTTPALFTPSPTQRIHIVQPNETLLDIAVRYQVPLQELAKVNEITDPTTIKPGDRLIIP